MDVTFHLFSFRKTHSEQEAERLGLFDVHGDVWSWCQETYQAYPNDPSDLHTVTEDVEGDAVIVPKVKRVLRGRSFYDLARVVRSACRFSMVPDTQNVDFGFRPARTFRPDRLDVSRNESVIFPY